MKKVIILGLVALLLAVFAYFWLFHTQTTKDEVLTGTDQEALGEERANTNVEAVEPKKGTGTLESIRLLAEDLECTITSTPVEQTAKVEGTYFVSDGNIRGDFLTESPDLSGQVLSSMIINGTTMYMWSEIEGQAYGMKIDLSTEEKAVVESRQPVSLDAEVKYDCKPWENVDRTVFVPPSDILFQNMSDLMKAGMEEAILYEGGAEMPY